MNNNIKTGIKLLTKKIDNMGKIPKLTAAIGIRAFLVIFIIGALLFIQQKFNLGTSATNAVDMLNASRYLLIYSFYMLAEFIIGAIIMDYVVGSNEKMKD